MRDVERRKGVPRISIIRREPRRMSRFGHLAADDFFQRVDALALAVERVHEMHSVCTISGYVNRKIC